MIFASLQWCLLFVIIVFTTTGENTKKKKATSKESKKRLVGGSSTSISKHPSVAEILYKGAHTCGGAIIHKRWVVTAVTCLEGYQKGKPNKYKVTVGSDVATEGTVYDVVQIILHPQFNAQPKGLFADIALLQIKGVFKLTRTVKIAKMDKGTLARKNIDYKHCSAAGWGLGHLGEEEDSLKELSLVPITQKECRSSFYTLKSNICLKSTSRDTAACLLDIGSPLYCRGLLVGIMSVGFGYCNEDTPEPFTKIANFYGWIQSHIEKPDKTRSLCTKLVGLCFWKYF